MNDIVSGNIQKRKERAGRILSSITNLPSIPIVVYEVTKIINDPSSSATQLSKVISKDQGLVAKVLSVANSPLYGIPRRVSTIEFAIVILGFNHIKNIVIALSMMDSLKTIGDKRFDSKQYWTHSIMVATAAKRIADDLGFSTSGEAFTAGLLHDLGLPVINKYFTKEFKSIIENVEKDGMSLRGAELRAMGVTHSEIGKILMEKWNLPEQLSDVVLYHHNPIDAPENKELTAIVHLADYMTYKLEIADFLWDSNKAIDTGIIDILQLGDLDYLTGFIEGYRSLFEEQVNNFSF